MGDLSVGEGGDALSQRSGYKFRRDPLKALRERGWKMSIFLLWKVNGGEHVSVYLYTCLLNPLHNKLEDAYPASPN